MISVLYVDDEYGFFDIVKHYLEKSESFKVDTSESAKIALKKIEKNHYDAVVSDYQMPEMNGIEFLNALRKDHPYLPFIIFTGRGRETVAIDALNNGADFYLQKGGEPKALFTELRNMIEKAVDRRRMENALHESEERYRNVVQAQTEFITRFLPDGTHIFVNEAYCRYFDKTAEDMVGYKFIPDIPSEDSLRVRQHVTSLNQEKPVGTIEHRIIMPDGEVRWQQWNDRAIFNEHGEVVEFQSVGRDVTDRIRAEKALRNKNEELHAAYEQLAAAEEELRQNYEELTRREEELHAAYEQLAAIEEELRQNYEELTRREEELQASEERYRNVVQAQTEFITRFLPDGTHIFVNEAYCRYFDKTAGEMIGHIFIPDIPGEDSMRVRQHIASLTRENPVGTIEHRIIMPGGEVRWQQWNDRAIFNEDGEVVEYQSVGRDVTDRIRAEEALLHSEELSTGIIDHLPDATFVVDEKGNVISWNQAMEELTGVQGQDIVGKGDYEYSVPFYGERRPIMVDLIFHDDEAVRRNYSFISRTGETLIAETEIATPQGKNSVLWVKVSPLYDRDGMLIGAIETVRDVTDRKQLEGELHQTYKQLQLMNSITRHDILNQLTALMGYIELSGENLNDPARMAEFIGKEQTIAEAIEEQITFTRDYQNLGIKAPKWHNVHENIDQAMAILPLMNIRVNVDNCDIEIFADPLFDKVFYNLIDNSLKYGGDRMTAIDISSHESGNSLTIMYEDDGVGIAPEEKPSLFTQGFGKHTGLGLFLIRKILSITGINIIEAGKRGEWSPIRDFYSERGFPQGGLSP